MSQSRLDILQPGHCFLPFLIGMDHPCIQSIDALPSPFLSQNLRGDGSRSAASQNAQETYQDEEGSHVRIVPLRARPHK